MKRKLLSAILIAATIFSISTICYAEDKKEISIYVNGNKLYSDVAPQIIDGSTLVPLRVIFEALGATVEWNQETKTVSSTLDETSVKLTIGENKLYKNGNEISLSVPAQIIEGRTLVPVRAISESFGYFVDWYNEIKAVSIKENKRVALIPYYNLDGKVVAIEKSLSSEYELIGWSNDINKIDKNVVTMYSEGGKKTNVSISNIETYLAKGWDIVPFVWMYADDDKSIEIPNAKIDDYRLVGWYTLDEYIDHLLYLGKYEYAVAFLNEKAHGTINDVTVNEMLKKINDQTNKPFIAYAWSVSETSLGIPKAIISLNNTTNKEIVSFEIKFTCYDAYWQETFDYGSAIKTAFSDRDRISPYSSFTSYLTLYGNERTHYISTPKVVKVAFSDGTFWSE